MDLSECLGLPYHQITPNQDNKKTIYQTVQVCHTNVKEYLQVSAAFSEKQQPFEKPCKGPWWSDNQEQSFHDIFPSLRTCFQLEQMHPTSQNGASIVEQYSFSQQ
ncbi:hypothetical protein Droror1_Dr00022182 [Drosera rotundifolia]